MIEQKVFKTVTVIGQWEVFPPVRSAAAAL